MKNIIKFIEKGRFTLKVEMPNYEYALFCKNRYNELKNKKLICIQSITS